MSKENWIRKKKTLKKDRTSTLLRSGQRDIGLFVFYYLKGDEYVKKDT